MSAGNSTAFLGDKAPHLPFLVRSKTLSNASSGSASPLPQFASPPPSSIPPLVSLELRIRWLEALVSGIKPSPKNASKSKGKPKQPPNELELSQEPGLVRRTEEVQQALDQAVEANDSLRKFVSSYDEYEHILMPAGGVASPGAPSYEEMSFEEMNAYLSDMESDIRTADRDLREIIALDNRGVTGAGKLAEHEALKPRLRALLEAQAEDMATYLALEAQINGLMKRYSSHVTALSELFVTWDRSIKDAGEQTTKLERAEAEYRKTAFE